MLTGRAKIDFEDWLSYELRDNAFFENVDFYECPFSMQWGMYVEFFDAYDIICQAKRKLAEEIRGGIFYQSNVNGYLGAWLTLDEARRSAVKDANEFFNNGES